MPKFVIERNVPGAGEWSAAEIRDAARKSNEVLRGMGAAVQWQHSYVVDDKIYCVYVADDEGLVLEHAKRSGFPADRVTAVRAVIDPTSGE